MDKQTQVMETAIRLFSRNGYFSTSVQEIAAECGISKGSLYKFFDSKEDLLIQVFQYNLERMLQKAKHIDLDNSLTEEERFKKVIIVELEGMLENKDFFNILSKSLPVDKNKKIIPLMKRTRAVMVNWHKYCLEQAFGNRVTPYIWDLTMMLQGMIKEFAQLVIHENKEVEVEEIAELLVDSLRALVHNPSRHSPVLTPDLMKEYEQLEKVVAQPKREQLSELFERIKDTIKNMDVEEQHREELQSTLVLLREELTSKEPRMFLIRALMAYLDKETKIKPFTKKLEAFI